MPGIWITTRQVELYRQTRKEGSTQIIAAAKSGISERSGRAIEQGVRRKPARASASVRTRPDPFLAVWDNDLLPLLERLPMLQPITLREHYNPLSYHGARLAKYRAQRKRLAKYIFLI